MAHDQIANTQAAYEHNVGLTYLRENIPSLKPGSGGVLDSRTMMEINRKYPKYKKLEGKTGVPWKAIAAMDQATGNPIGIVTQKVQEYASSKGLRLNPDSDTQDVLHLLNTFRAEHPDKTALLDASLSYYYRIDRVYHD